MNEGSTSRAYSFNLYLEPGIIHYKRQYKKIYTIYSDFISISYFIFVVMKNLAKLFKKVESNKKLMELLFENLKEKPNIFKENLKRLNIKNNNLKFKTKYNGKRNSVISINNIKLNDNEKERKSMDIRQISSNLNVLNSSIFLNEDKLKNNNNSGKNSSSKSNSKCYHQNKKNIAIINNNNVSNINLLQSSYITKGNINLGKNDKFNRVATNYNKSYIKKKLFPCKYYLYSIFIINLNKPKENCLFSSRFLKAYTFLCQLFDISTYLSLQREFNSLKQIINKKSVNLIENNRKININSYNFMKEISESLGENKFYILAQDIRTK
jgi:hypothetical protein